MGLPQGKFDDLHHLNLMIYIFELMICFTALCAKGQGKFELFFI
jgi:hypothetical protein